ncbi:CaiB/BaiF CoA transferase family protein [Elioraea tepida]|nr:CaiB/BaiF CoA-transferase family protein [Elioraea tepida]
MPMVSPGALAGLKVIDLTRVLGGPYCTMVLSDHGAEVIKIEPPQGDEVRDWGPPFHEHPEGGRDASYFIGVNRNKASLALDLAREEARAVLLRLLEGADVLVENFKPGTMEKWGLGYGTLRERFPRLIHCRISGFGAEGPLGGFPGYDAIVQAMVGLMSINGTETSGPTRLATPVVDIGTGLFSAIAILMALFERQRSGEGQFIDMTLHDCGMALLHPHAANYFLSGKRPVATGNPHPNLAPYDKFRTATCEIFIGTGNDATFRKMCDLLGRPELAEDPRFRTNADRMANRAALSAIVQEIVGQEDGHALSQRLLANGLPAGPVLYIDEVAQAPHTKARGMVAELGWYRGINTPIKFSRTPGGARRPPPRFGQDGDAVLAAHGFSEAEIAALKAEGVLVTERRTGEGRERRQKAAE